MSISVQNITKVYGSQYALNDVSLEIEKGEVLGFLGPNGAGKSTLMKIITCYIPQTDGEGSVCDLKVKSQSNEIKKIVGYLPENTPLYYDMYVKEYLRFLAHVHKVPDRKRRVNEMIANIIAIHILVLDPCWSLVKNLMTNIAPTISGASIKRATGTYHQ